jgi:hypothetical protein
MRTCLAQIMDRFERERRIFERGQNNRDVTVVLPVSDVSMEH